MEWKVSKGPVAYQDALDFMEARVADIYNGNAEECVWFLEHPPLYTGGTSAQADDLLDARFPVHKTGRGGEYTYHGPGQRVAYVMMDLKRRAGGPDVRKYVCDLEEWIIQTLCEFGIAGERREGRVGIWVPPSPDGFGETSAAYHGDQKIAAIGVRVKRWVTMHGIAINVDPDLSHFDGIVPCGISDAGVTSMAALGIDARMGELDKVLKEKFVAVFKSSNFDRNCHFERM